MKEKEPDSFPWSFLFLVIAISFLVFSGFIKLISAAPADVALFFKIGIVLSVVSAVTFFGSKSMKLAGKENNSPDKEKER